MFIAVVGCSVLVTGSLTVELNSASIALVIDSTTVVVSRTDTATVIDDGSSLAGVEVTTSMNVGENMNCCTLDVVSK